ncbi:hypothetical protein CU097_003303 [Rhizopus azygosporus]|uniref:MIT domain-containing protein n=1 Tax=Rhizopus azygosporus TaxID=86630 RepID=A0A367J3A9_RHIAZ|nr:hypothetical protein CU097_003303 [Rhizopus azygosporus]
MSTEAPVNAGHRFANAAEDFEEEESWEKAAEAHFKAAEQFQIALNDVKDAETAKTLQLLIANHKRKANDLDRKIQRMKTITTQKDNQLTAHHNNNMRMMGSSGGLRNALPDKKGNSSSNNNKHNGLLVSRLANRSEYLSSEDGLQRADGIGESYALLSNDDENDDPFNKFLEVVEGLVQNLINPAVAFASAPLNENDIPVPIATQTPLDPDMDHDLQLDNNNMMESFYIVPKPKDYQERQYSIIKTGKDDTLKENDSEKNKEFYQHENEKLRKQIALLTKRVKALELAAEEGNTLKSSIIQFRNDVHRQAKRIMQSHHESSMRLSAVALPSTGASSINVNSIRHPGLIGGGGNDLVNRLRELEEENRQLKIQNEKQKMLVSKYKERWEMLKENAKKRRASTATTIADSMNTEVNNRG